MKRAEPARRKISAGERRRQLLANAVAWLIVMGLAGWLARHDYDVFVRAPFPARASSASLPALAFMPAESLATKDDVRRILSPAVFALPGASGFSAPLEIEPARSPPPPAPDTSASFIRNGAPFTPAAYGETRLALTELIERPRELKRPRPEPLDGTLLPARAGQSAAYTFVWQQVNGLMLPTPDALGLPPATSAVPWQATASICLSPQGFVEKVLLERPSPEAAVNDALARGLRAVLFDPPAGEPCRRLVIRFQPATTTANFAAPPLP